MGGDPCRGEAKLEVSCSSPGCVPATSRPRSDQILAPTVHRHGQQILMTAHLILAPTHKLHRVCAAQWLRGGKATHALSAVYQGQSHMGLVRFAFAAGHKRTRLRERAASEAGHGAGSSACPLRPPLACVVGLGDAFSCEKPAKYSLGSEQQEYMA